MECAVCGNGLESEETVFIVDGETVCDLCSEVVDVDRCRSCGHESGSNSTCDECKYLVELLRVSKELQR
jgi:hypothetical protein